MVRKRMLARQLFQWEKSESGTSPCDREVKLKNTVGPKVQASTVNLFILTQTSPKQLGNETRIN